MYANHDKYMGFGRFPLSTSCMQITISICDSAASLWVGQRDHRLAWSPLRVRASANPLGRMDLKCAES